MQSDQDNLTHHSAAPLQQIIKALDDQDGPLILETLQSTIFNWVPGFGSQNPQNYENLENIAAEVRPDVGFVVNAGLGGEKGWTMFMEFRGTGMTREQHRVFARELERVTRWIVDGGNWGRDVGRFRECLGEA